MANKRPRLKETTSRINKVESEVAVLPNPHNQREEVEPQPQADSTAAELLAQPESISVDLILTDPQVVLIELVRDNANLHHIVTDQQKPIEILAE